MKQFVGWAEAAALSAGGVGLLLVAFVDASFLSLPEANDFLVVWLTLRAKPLMLYYAAMATLGSVAGSMVIYYLGRKGGEALLRRRLSSEQAERTLARFRRWGMATVIVPAMLPPPVPFKAFCLAAGVTGMTPVAFAMATAIGRGVRYVGVGVLALYFGDMAVTYLKQHGSTVAWWVSGLTLAAIVLYYWRHQRRRATV